ncbi:MAG TPA: AAA family ATPase, partial [Thermomicrobiales bacterium]|nr:AAA family ATPase [Thermomicrobiales bacterium]
MDTSHFSPGRSPAEPTPIVGRSAEQVLLYEQLAGVAQGQGRVCLISGEAGIGKSTLVRDVVRQARELGFRVLSGQCHDLMASPPYGLWLDLVQRYRMDHEGEDVVVPEPFADGRVGDVRDQNEVFSKMWTFLAGIARGTTTVVTLEDVHWADPVSIELIRFLASHLDHLPVCLVLTYRVDELTRQNPVYRAIPMLLRESGGIRIDLAGLRLPDLAMLVAIRYGLPSDDCSRLAACLLRYSEGNPFFALELLHTLEQAGEERGLHWSGTGWRLGALNSVAIPGLVRQVIELRVERLDPDVVEALVLAAVIGQGVPLELWQRLLGVDDGRMLHVIEDALDAHILDADATGDHVYFVHALTRETLYEHVLPSRRRAMHLDIANALLETEHPDSESVAYHLERAGDPRAADWMIFAGERAQRAYAWLAARDRFASAAQSLIDVPGEELRRARLLYRCGRLLRYADAPQGLEDIRLAQRLAEQVGSRMLAAEAEYSRGLLHCFADSWVRGLEEMTAGIDRIEALPL